MKRIKKIWLISFLFVIMLSVFPVASSLMFGARESYVSALVSQSSLSLASGRIHTVTVEDPVTGDREVIDCTQGSSVSGAFDHTLSRPQRVSDHSQRTRFFPVPAQYHALCQGRSESGDSA